MVLQGADDVRINDKKRKFWNWAEHKYTRSFGFTRSSGCTYHWQNLISIIISRSDCCKAKVCAICKNVFQKLIGFAIGGFNLEHLRHYVSAAGAIFLDMCINFPWETLVFVRFSTPKTL